MNFKKKLLLNFFFILQNTVFAQNYFTANIKDSITLEPIIGAVVLQESTENGSATDANGKIRFPVDKSGDVVFIVQCIGYSKKIEVVNIPQKDSVITILLSSNNQELNEVTVTSVRTNSRIEDIPTRIEIIGADDLNEENGIKPANILSILGDIAGIQIQQVSASSGNTYARIQGLNGRYTQILKDGVPLYGGLSGNFGVMQIPPLDLKQIEIIKGSASTLYGGDAIGGILNLISKDPSTETELDFTVNRSTLKETNINGYYSKKYNKIGYSIFAGQTIQEESDIDKDGLSDVPKLGSTIIHPKFLFYFSPKSSLTLNYTGTFEERRGGNMVYINSAFYDTLYHVDNQIKRNSGDAKWLYEFSKTKNLTVKFSSSNFKQILDTREYDFDATQLIYYSEISFYQKMKEMDWVFGMNVNGDDFNNNSKTLSEVKDYNYKTLGAFIQNSWHVNTKFTVESGFRLDHHSDFGFFPLPRLALLYRINNYFTTRVNGGLGYKIPILVTYANQETDLNKISPGTDLSSELSQGLNADLNFNKLLSDQFSITINQSFFYTNILKPVYDSSSTINQIAFVNADKGLRTLGFQTYARVKYKDFEFYLGYVFTDVKQLYEKINKAITVTPKHNLSTVIIYEPVEQWRFGIESSFIAGQLNDQYNPVKNYLIFASMIQYKIGRFSFVLNGENLLDVRQNKYEKIYEGSIDSPTFHKLWAPIDGRVINLSLKWSL